MPEGNPEPKNPLSPYYPSEVPSLSGNGRRWFALLLVAIILFSAGFSFFSFVASLL